MNSAIVDAFKNFKLMCRNVVTFILSQEDWMDAFRFYDDTLDAGAECLGLLASWWLTQL